MDTRTAVSKTKQQIDADLQTIKMHMPKTYQWILELSQPGALGREAFALVRRGLAGEEHCFFSTEAGYILGSPPFIDTDETPAVQAMFKKPDDWSLFFLFDRRLATRGQQVPPPIGTSSQVFSSSAGNSTPAKKPVGALAISPVAAPEGVR